MAVGYIYFIVYKSFRNTYPVGDGNTEMLCSKPIDSIEDIRGLERLILKNATADGLNIDAVVITWYSLMQTK